MGPRYVLGLVNLFNRDSDVGFLFKVGGTSGFLEKIACSRLSVNGKKACAGRAGSGKKNKSIPLVQRPLFRSSPLTESLEQAMDK